MSLILCRNCFSAKEKFTDHLPLRSKRLKGKEDREKKRKQGKNILKRKKKRRCRWVDWYLELGLPLPQASQCGDTPMPGFPFL